MVHNVRPGATLIKGRAKGEIAPAWAPRTKEPRVGCRATAYTSIRGKNGVFMRPGASETPDGRKDEKNDLRQKDGATSRALNEAVSAFTQTALPAHLAESELYIGPTEGYSVSPDKGASPDDPEAPTRGGLPTTQLEGVSTSDPHS